ncbi:MAG: polysaccharide lyase 6 family protein [Candidatus Sumerlaeia bacterium]|nr:polysaccharide lyase 6 family protein [Candidatus Sumerlaeia bacterium]
MNPAKVKAGTKGWVSAIAWVCLSIGQPAGAADYRAADISQFNEAVKKAAPGDSIILANGLWRDADLAFRATGTASQPITLRAETPGKTILCGQSRLHIGGSHLVVEGLVFRDGGNRTDAIEFRTRSDYPARHCRVTQCAILDYNPADPAQENKWVQIYGEHNRVDHCWFSGKTTRGPVLAVWLSDQPNYNRIDHNYFGRRPEFPKNGAEIIRIGDSDSSMQNSRTTVEFNYFEECNGEIETISNKSCENIYRCNTFERCQGTLTLRHGNRCVVEGNFFFGHNIKETGGVRVIGEEHRVAHNYFADLRGDGTRSALSIMNGVRNSPLNGYFQVKRAVIEFNTFVNCRSPIEIGSADSSRNSLPPEDCILRNNLVIGNKGTAILLKSVPLRMTWEGNVVQGLEPGLVGEAGIRSEAAFAQRGGDGLWRGREGAGPVGAALREKPLAASEVGPDWMRQP